MESCIWSDGGGDEEINQLQFWFWVTWFLGLAWAVSEGRFLNEDEKLIKENRRERVKRVPIP